MPCTMTLPRVTVFGIGRSLSSSSSSSAPLRLSDYDMITLILIPPASLLIGLGFRLTLDENDISLAQWDNETQERNSATHVHVREITTCGIGLSVKPSQGCNSLNHRTH